MIPLAMAGLLAVVAAAQNSEPRDPLAAISVYAGVWRAEVDQVNSEFGKVRHTSRLIANDCWRARNFYVCAQTVNGKQIALVVYTWDRSSGAYRAYSVPVDGGPAARSKLLIDGDEWFFPWDQEKAGLVIHFRVVNHFLGTDRIEYRREFSRDGASWTLIEKGIEDRQQEVTGKP